MGELAVEVVKLQTIVSNETVHALTNHSETLLYDFLKRAAD